MVFVHYSTKERISQMNTIVIGGRLVEKPVFSHEAYGERFFSFQMDVVRLSETKDRLNCIIPECLVESLKEETVICGEVRTRNVCVDERTTNVITVFVKDILGEFSEQLNTVSVDGFICKKRELRKTPSGRVIYDCIVACNRLTKYRSDYLPCIFWERKAIIASDLDIGTHIRLKGRLQSRVYKKKFEDGTVEERVAYEISASSFEVVKEVEDGESD